MTMTMQSQPPQVELRAAMQTSLFGAAPFSCAPLGPERIAAGEVHLDASSRIVFAPGWVQGSDELFEQLRRDMPWRAMQRPMYDRVVAVPRLICNVIPADLEPADALSVITKELEKTFCVRFSSIGLNYYRDGSDSVAWHRDRVGRARCASTVALVSLGSPRTLAVRPYRGSDRDSPRATPESLQTQATRLRWQLGQGDLLVMSGACQRDYEHCVPKESGVGPRISLAFRCREAA